MLITLFGVDGVVRRNLSGLETHGAYALRSLCWKRLDWSDEGGDPASPGVLTITAIAKSNGLAG